MGFTCGIIGMPNVGKSTLFNAVTQTQAAESANYPFCTIDPNVGCVSVFDARLNRLADSVKPQKVISAQLELVDIAGLVKGASKGEGLGNQFLANIRQVDAILHVLRCFEEDNITHVEGSVDPIRDLDIIETELLIADVEFVEKRLSRIEKQYRSGDKILLKEKGVLGRLLALLKRGDPARHLSLQDEQEQKIFRQLSLLTGKPMVYVCNVEEESAAKGNALSNRVSERAKQKNVEVVVLSVAIEAEVAQLESQEDKRMFLQELNLHNTGLEQVVAVGYRLLNQITFFTVGPKEVRAWTVKKGATAYDAAGVIHTDFQRGFIRAETISYDDYIKFGGEQGVKEAGRLRLEGRDYVVVDGDIFSFRFNV